MVAAPIIVESPLNIECKVTQIVPLGSHDMFLAQVVNVQADDAFIDPETQKFELERADLIAYSHGQYYTLGDMIGKFGWSVTKKRNHKKHKS